MKLRNQTDVRRRQVLSSFALSTATLLAGCPESSEGDTNPITITNISKTINVDFPLELTVSVHRRTATPQQPAALAIEWRNNSDTTITIGEGDVLTLDKVPNTAETAVLLHPETVGDETTEFSNCWIYTPDRLSGAAGYREATLAPGETLAAVSEFYAFKSGLLVFDECLSPGEYSFTEEGGILRPDELETVFDWQLDITITR